MLNVLFYISYFLLILAQFTSISKSSGLNIYIFDIFIAIFSLYGLLSLFLKKKLFIPKTLILFIMFFFIALISLILNSNSLDSAKLMISGSYLIRYLLYLLSGIIVFNLLNEKKLESSSLVKFILFTGFFLAITGFIQLLILPDFALLNSALGWDPHKNRLASTFFDPNFLGAYIAIVLSLIMSNLNNTKPTISKKYLYFLLCLLVFALILTFSRSAWLTFGIIVFVFGVLKNRYLLLLGILIAFLSYFAVPRVQTRISGITDPADSAHFRIISWRNTLDIASDNLVFGVGFNSYRYAQIEYGFFSPGNIGGNSGAGSDSSLLLVLATTGIIGLSVYVLGYIYVLYYALVNTRDIGIISIIGAIMINSIFINSLFYPQIMFILFIMFVLMEFNSITLVDR